MMRVTLGRDHVNGATWSAAFGVNKDGECFLLVYMNDTIVSTTYDHRTPPRDDAELKRWAADALRARAASWLEEGTRD